MPLLAATALMLIAGYTPHTDRGQADFDEFLKRLDGHGTWVQEGDGPWAFEPKAGGAPLSDGQWVYCDYGWYFQGDAPTSWATDHFGTWRLGEDRIWRWEPGEHWHAHTVEWRTTDTHVGWRPCPLSAEGAPTEPDERRYRDPAEWFWLPKEKLKGRFSRADIVTGADGEKYLEESQPLYHTYVSWREIDRPGPDPYDLYGLSKPEVLRSMAVPAALTPLPGLNEDLEAEALMQLARKKQAEAAIADDPAAGADEITSAPPEPGQDEPKLQVLAIRCLPAPHAPIPKEAKPGELYVYRPVFHQDYDGIQKRIEIWLKPKARVANRTEVQKVLSNGTLIFDGTTPNPNFPPPAPPGE